MKIITWNMQGSTGQRQSKWTSDIQRLFNDAEAEVLLLQEAGTPPPTARQVAVPPFLTAEPPDIGFANWGYFEWNMGTRHRPNMVKIYWVQTDAGGNRNNMALAFRTNPEHLLIVQNPTAIPGRPALGARLLNGIQELDLFTVHAGARIQGADAPGLLGAIDAAGTADWAAGGDFNRDPQVLRQQVPYTECPHAAVVTHPGTGTNLDYMFKNFVPPVTGVVDDNFIVSDHYPVAYVL